MQQKILAIDRSLARCLVHLVAAVLLSLAAWGGAARAQEDASPESRETAIEATQEALREGSRFPWYDRSNDDVRRLNVKPRDAADSANRGSKWTSNQTATATTGGRRSFAFLGNGLQWLGLTALCLLLGVLLFLVTRAFLKEEVSEGVATRKVVETSRDVDRVEALPFHLRKGTGDFLAEARRLYEAGEYSEAIVYLFSYQLVQLDKQHLIRLAKGKTNRTYLRELRQRPNLRGILEQTMVPFEDAFFGGKTLTRERFEACWQRLEEFRSELDRLERAAA